MRAYLTFCNPEPRAYGLWIITVFFVFMCLLNSAQGSHSSGEIAHGWEQRDTSGDGIDPTKYNYTLYQAVSTRPITGRPLEKEMLKYPKADFRKFPMEVYSLDTSRLPIVLMGELIPDELLDLPLWVVNEAYGRDTITLRESMTGEWLILDFWTEWCPPCITSMMKWEGMNAYHPNFVLLGVYPSYRPHRAAIETRKKGWFSTQVIGSSSLILSHAFLGYRASLGPSVWIRDGRLFGVSSAGALTDEELKKVLSDEIKALPDHAIYKNPSTR